MNKKKKLILKFYNKGSGFISYKRNKTTVPVKKLIKYDTYLRRHTTLIRK